jgi:hypothetical protein
VAADAVVVLVGAHDHRRRVPADVRADAPLGVLVAREPRLLLGRDRVHVRRRDGGRQADLQLAGTLEEGRDQVPGSALAAVLDHRIEALEPLVGLGRIDVREGVHEPVEDHATMFAP